MYRTPLSEEALEAFKTMPLLDGAYVVSLFYCPRQKLAAYEEKWREWLRTHDKRFWPVWVDKWAQHKKASGGGK